MTMKEIKIKASELGIKLGKKGKIDAVRALQTAEGYQPCFCTNAMDTCGQMDCCFRSDCS
jgi:hypothetical protein